MASTPLGADVIQFNNREPAAPQAGQRSTEDPRVTSVLRWVTSLASALSLAILLGIVSTLIGMRDNQIIFKTMLDTIITGNQGRDYKVNKMEERMSDHETRLRVLERR